MYPKSLPDKDVSTLLNQSEKSPVQLELFTSPKAPVTTVTDRQSVLYFSASDKLHPVYKVLKDSEGDTETIRFRSEEPFTGRVQRD